MKKKIVAILPFIIMPIFIPSYIILDNLILVDIFGCGCVPSAQTNMLNIPYNANDLRLTVFSALTVVLSVWGIIIAIVIIAAIGFLLFMLLGRKR